LLVNVSTDQQMNKDFRSPQNWKRWWERWKDALLSQTSSTDNSSTLSSPV